MDEKLQDSKQILRGFMREHYTDERLAWLLAHARSGRLGFHSCCCFIGIVTADHPLRAEGQFEDGDDHYKAASLLPMATDAERAFLRLGRPGNLTSPEGNARRLRRLISIVRAEMRRREREREAARDVTELCGEAAPKSPIFAAP